MANIVHIHKYIKQIIHPLTLKIKVIFLKHLLKYKVQKKNKIVSFNNVLVLIEPNKIESIPKKILLKFSLISKF